MTHTTRMMLVGAMFGLGASLIYAPSAVAMGSWVEGEEADACANDDGAFDEAAFVIATEPKAGERVESGFAVEGCSRSFESNVCLLYTSDAADDLLCVDLGGRRIIKKKNKKKKKIRREYKQ